MAGSDGWKLNGRPMSTIALNFSAALDDLFKLGSVGELEDTVEQKYPDALPLIISQHVETQKSQLEHLDARLREADERLRKLELKHKRMSRHFSDRPSLHALFDNKNLSDSDDTGVSPTASEIGESRQK